MLGRPSSFNADESSGRGRLRFVPRLGPPRTRLANHQRHRLRPGPAAATPGSAKPDRGARATNGEGAAHTDAAQGPLWLRRANTPLGFVALPASEPTALSLDSVLVDWSPRRLHVACLVRAATVGWITIPPLTGAVQAAP